MQTNITKLAPVDMGPVMNKRDCVSLLIHERRLARLAIRNIEAVLEVNRADRRQAKKYRASDNPLLIRNAEVIDARIAERENELTGWEHALVCSGYCIRELTAEIDRLIPINELFDILEVNPVDRSKVGSTAGFKEIVFVHGLEDSATYRDGYFKEGPLFRALMLCMEDMMKTNHALQQKITDSLFGKGGMLEFVPTYSRTPDGHFERNPPKLRMADEVDLAAKPALH